jgi:hypothetical protein
VVIRFSVIDAEAADEMRINNKTTTAEALAIE